MTIDERIDRLTERMEALTQSVEILTHDVAEMRETMESGFRHLHTSIETLLLVAKNHEARLERLEGN